MIVTKIPVAEKRKPRVCAYVRVSTDKEAQEDSFAFQSWYWNDKLSKEDDVEYVGLFSDEGISGKRMRNRRGLNEMLTKVRNGEIDRIYTKSISRFARNYTELMAVVRELRDKGIPIIFEKENIDTLDPKCGLILSVMASLAEEELISMSKNLQWAARKRYANGSVELARIYGYRWHDKQLVIQQDEAEVVRYIYDLYLQGNGFEKITKILREENRIKPLSGREWNKNAVQYILTNEKYIGDSLLQKTIYELGVKRKNDGEIPQYYIEDSHEAIVTKETFEQVQASIKKKALKFHPNEDVYSAARYPLSGKIKCGNCGASYRRKTCAKGTTYENIKWSCMTKEQFTKTACDNHEIKHEIIVQLLVDAYNECLDNHFTYSGAGAEHEKLKALLQTEQELKALHTKGYISDKQYKAQSEKLLAEIQSREATIKTLQTRNIDKKRFEKSAVYTDDMADFLIRATVADWKVTFRFANGYETTRNYTNGRAGNVNGKLCKHKA